MIVVKRQTRQSNGLHAGWWRAGVIFVAVAAVFAPIPTSWVERAYSTWAYPLIQGMLTRVSNLVPFAMFDALILVAVIAFAYLLYRDVSSRRQGAFAVVARLLLRTAVLAASLYLAFLLLWGLNYRREKLVAKLQVDRARISAASTLLAATTAVDQLNALHDRAHDLGWRSLGEIDSTLATAFRRVNHDLGVQRDAVVGRPKITLLNPYFRRAGVEGMTDPYFLETLVQQEILPFERPFVVAHEWSHLAGFAEESEASFVGWLTCLRGSPSHQYSGWLFLYGELQRALRPRDRAAVSAMLGTGPRDDLRAIATRYQQHVNPRVSQVGWGVYDRYLKANHVESGTASYDEVVQLVLGARFGPDWTPMLR
jgi:hypothetical protein